MTVKQLLESLDSDELSEWYAYDQRWPLPDQWLQTARLCRIVMAASGNYKRHDIPEESVFIPTVVKPYQTNDQMLAELQKLTQ